MWPEKSSEDSNIDIEKRATEKIDVLKTEIKGEISGILRQVGKQDSKLQNVQNSIEEIVNKAISTTRRVEIETQEEMSMADVLNNIISFLRRREGEQVSLRRLITYPGLRRRTTKTKIIEGLEFLVKEKAIKISGSLDNFDTQIELIK
jgi:hypothetical protein